jgi:hypothetical protein
MVARDSEPGATGSEAEEFGTHTRDRNDVREQAAVATPTNLRDNLRATRDTTAQDRGFHNTDKSPAAGWTAVQPREYHSGVDGGRLFLAGAALTPEPSDEATMEIRFPAEAPAYRGSNLTVVFAALVDGETVPCAISVEALEDHFGAYSEDLEGWMRAFDAGRPRIEAVAREHLQISNGTPVLLKSGHFPPGNVAD